jgi:hypothetical protein
MLNINHRGGLTKARKICYYIGRQNEEVLMPTFLKKIAVFAAIMFVLCPTAYGQKLSRNDAAVLLQEKLGMYPWGQLPMNSGDPYVVAVLDAKDLGVVAAIRVAMTPYWDPRGVPDLRPLDQKMYRDDYWYILTNFPVVVLTAYDAASYDRRYHNRSQFSDEDWATMLATVRDEFRRFALELGKLPGMYVVSNWESENDCTDAQWSACLEYYQARLDGVIAGRDEAKALGSPGNVMNGFEFFLVDTGFNNGTTIRQVSGFRSALTELRSVDYFIYSAWEAVNANRVPACLTKMHEACATAGVACQFIAGEVGVLWDHDDAEGSYLHTVLTQFAADPGVQWIFNWNEYDQPGEGVRVGDTWYDQSHWGSYDLNRSLTPQGERIKGWLVVPRIKIRIPPIPEPSRPRR